MPAIADKHLSVFVIDDDEDQAEAQRIKRWLPRSHIKAYLSLCGCKTSAIHSITNSVWSKIEALKEEQNNTSVTIGARQLRQLIYNTLDMHDRPTFLALYPFARSVQDGKRTLFVLLAGCTGAGKSALASLLSDRLRIATVISSDVIRHFLATRKTTQNFDVLSCSTYEAFKLMPDTMAHSKRVRKGFKRQCRPIVDHLTELLLTMNHNRVSAIVEGVHLLPQDMIRLMKRIPSVVPFVIFISNPEKHKERFAVRSKLMTLEPNSNRYVDMFDNIRTIQKYILQKANERRIPCINNTNVDRTVAALHTIILRCMRHLCSGEHSLLEVDENDGVARTNIMFRELEQMQSAAWSSKDMERRIRFKVEKRTLLDHFSAMRIQSQQQQYLTEERILDARNRNENASHCGNVSKKSSNEHSEGQVFVSSRPDLYIYDSMESSEAESEFETPSTIERRDITNTISSVEDDTASEDYNAHGTATKADHHDIIFNRCHMSQFEYSDSNQQSDDD